MTTKPRPWHKLPNGRPDNYALSLYVDFFDGGDPWGSTMGFLFPLAEIIRARYDEIVDGYRPPPFAPAEDKPLEYGDDAVTTELWDALDSGLCTETEIRYAWTILSRYEKWCRLAGLDY